MRLRLQSAKLCLFKRVNTDEDRLKCTEPSPGPVSPPVQDLDINSKRKQSFICQLTKKFNKFKRMKQDNSCSEQLRTNSGFDESAATQPTNNLNANHFESDQIVEQLPAVSTQAAELEMNTQRIATGTTVYSIFGKLMFLGFSIENMSVREAVGEILQFQMGEIQELSGFLNAISCAKRTSGAFLKWNIDRRFSTESLTDLLNIQTSMRTELLGTKCFEDFMKMFHQFGQEYKSALDRHERMVHKYPFKAKCKSFYERYQKRLGIDTEDVMNVIFGRQRAQREFDDICWKLSKATAPVNSNLKNCDAVVRDSKKRRSFSDDACSMLSIEGECQDEADVKSEIDDEVANSGIDGEILRALFYEQEDAPSDIDIDIDIDIDHEEQANTAFENSQKDMEASTVLMSPLLNVEEETPPLCNADSDFLRIIETIEKRVMALFHKDEKANIEKKTSQTEDIKNDRIVEQNVDPGNYLEMNSEGETESNLGSEEGITAQTSTESYDVPQLVRNPKLNDNDQSHTKTTTLESASKSHTTNSHSVGSCGGFSSSEDVSEGLINGQIVAARDSHSVQSLGGSKNDELPSQPTPNVHGSCLVYSWEMAYNGIVQQNLKMQNDFFKRESIFRDECQQLRDQVQPLIEERNRLASENYSLRVQSSKLKNKFKKGFWLRNSSKEVEKRFQNSIWNLTASSAAITQKIKRGLENKENLSDSEIEELMSKIYSPMENRYRSSSGSVVQQRLMANVDNACHADELATPVYGSDQCLDQCQMSLIWKSMIDLLEEDAPGIIKRLESDIKGSDAKAKATEITNKTLKFIHEQSEEWRQVGSSCWPWNKSKVMRKRKSIISKLEQKSEEVKKYGEELWLLMGNNSQ
ncbi:mannosyltransferase [Candida orthopsilosis Co 90-125]|uniref:Mannosyltransferase n=1 Tax=Candida orthopsilosis (strain 90-125) TaxID=1136231 RepID=H8X0W7_CANO9|nr:mannosyltransferase [Candida orthopsilosis Co 90-125]CCG22006.1 mannosyltransferase [Candida orthopsilosis Co 90-125]